MVADVGHRLDGVDSVERAVIEFEWFVEVADGEVELERFGFFQDFSI
tara:strand:- start:307 stop:447 length:141 start_codon:yes stop_codon:yes gene_type:complete